MGILDYKAYFFDCDGVIIDSNKIKNEAFFECAKSYGEEAANKLVQYHLDHAGISRHKKLDYFFLEVLKKNPQEFQKEYNQCLTIFNEISDTKVPNAPLCDGFTAFYEAIPKSAIKVVISGTPQNVLVETLNYKKMNSLFQEILGTPLTKIEHLKNLLLKFNLDPLDCVFIGDGNTDYLAAKHYSMPFIFASAYSNFLDYESFFAKEKGPITITSTLDKLI